MFDFIRRFWRNVRAKYTEDENFRGKMADLSAVFIVFFSIFVMSLSHLYLVHNVKDMRMNRFASSIMTGGGLITSVAVVIMILMELYPIYKKTINTADPGTSSPNTETSQQSQVIQENVDSQEPQNMFLHSPVSPKRSRSRGRRRGRSRGTRPRRSERLKDSQS